MNDAQDESCPLCGGARRPGETTFSVELGFGILVVRHVPALVCAQCGADWLRDGIAEDLERRVEEARQHHNEVAVVSYS